MMLQLPHTFSMEEKVVRKTTVQKSVRRVATKTVPARTVAKTPTAVLSRKAPSRKSANTSAQKNPFPKVFMIVCVLFLVLMGVSFLIGSTDKGELDVAQKIADRKEHATPEEKVILENVGDQKPQGVPTASLTGMGKDDSVVSPVETVSTSSTTTTELQATTTIESATSSDTIPAEAEGNQATQ